MDFIEKGVISHKYLADGCEFKKIKDKYKLISTQNDKYLPFVGKTFQESKWDLISKATVTSGVKYDEVYGLLLDHFRSGNTIFNKDANILLKKGEEVIFQSSNNIVLKEPKSIRVTNSVHAGTSRRHGKTSFGYGASKSVGESKDVVKMIDVGQIIITNKRFIFSGNNRTVDVTISQITGITPYTDGFKLQRKNKQKPEYFINIDSYFFNYFFRDETYFVIMDGRIIKSLIEGGLNKTPQTSKLQQLSSQPMISDERKTVNYAFDEFELEYASDWKQIEDKGRSHFFTIEKINGTYRSEIYLSKSKLSENQEDFENQIKGIFKQKDFELTEFKHTEINGIDMLVVSSQKDVGKNVVELDVTYFKNHTNSYSIFLTRNVLDNASKQDYLNIVNSIKIKNSLKIDNDDSELKMKYCPNCGTRVEQDGNFCVNCGFKLS